MQKAVIQHFLTTKQNIFVSGNAGTGKSFLLGILRELMQNKTTYMVVAKTGLAAINIDGKTIGSVFKDSSHKKKVDLIQFKVLIIDEIGTVPLNMFKTIDDYLRKANPINSHLPMGGVRIIAFGDFHQIPPYDCIDGKPQAINNIENSELWKSLDFKYFELKESMRNEHSDQLAILNYIRNKDENNEVIEYLTKHCMDVSKVDETYVHLFFNGNSAKEFNNSKLKEAKGELFTYEPKIIDKKYKIENVSLKIGARVMCTKNIKHKSLYNGSTGTVIDASRRSVTVRFDNLSEPVEIDYESYYTTNIENGKTVSVCIYKHIPLTLAWGITILKSQGLTIEKVALHGTKNMNAGFFYVAITRVKDLNNLVLMDYIPGQRYFTL